MIMYIREHVQTQVTYGATLDRANESVCHSALTLCLSRVYVSIDEDIYSSHRVPFTTEKHVAGETPTPDANQSSSIVRLSVEVTCLLYTVHCMYLPTLSTLVRMHILCACNIGYSLLERPHRFCIRGCWV